VSPAAAEATAAVEDDFRQVCRASSQPLAPGGCGHLFLKPLRLPPSGTDNAAAGSLLRSIRRVSWAEAVSVVGTQCACLLLPPTTAGSNSTQRPPPHPSAFCCLPGGRSYHLTHDPQGVCAPHTAPDAAKACARLLQPAAAALMGPLQLARHVMSAVRVQALLLGWRR